MNNLEIMKNIQRLQAKVDEYVPDRPLPDLIYPSSMTDGLYHPRKQAEYGEVNP